MSEPREFSSPAKYWQSSIFVNYIPYEATSEEDIIIHFQRRRNGGDDVKHVVYPYTGPGTALVVFEDENVVQSVVQKKHELSGQVVLVQPMKPQVFSRVTVVLESRMIQLPSISRALKDLQYGCKVKCVSNVEKDKVVITGTWDQIKRVNELFESLNVHSSNPELDILLDHKFDEVFLVVEDTENVVEVNKSKESRHSMINRHDKLHQKRVVEKEKNKLEGLDEAEKSRHFKEKTSYLETRSQAERPGEHKDNGREYEGAYGLARNINLQNIGSQSLPYIPYDDNDDKAYLYKQKIASSSTYMQAPQAGGARMKSYDFKLDVGESRTHAKGSISDTDSGYLSDRYNNRQDITFQSLPPMALSDDVHVASGRERSASLDKKHQEVNRNQIKVKHHDQARNVSEDVANNQDGSVHHNMKRYEFHSTDRYNEERAVTSHNIKGRSGLNTRYGDGNVRSQVFQSGQIHVNQSGGGPDTFSYSKKDTENYVQEIIEKRKERNSTEIAGNRSREAEQFVAGSSQEEFEIKDHESVSPQAKHLYADDTERMEVDQDDTVGSNDDAHSTNGKGKIIFTESILVNMDTLKTTKEYFSAKLQHIKDSNTVHVEVNKIPNSPEGTVDFESSNEACLNSCKDEIVKMYQAVVFDPKDAHVINIENQKQFAIDEVSSLVGAYNGFGASVNLDFSNRRIVIKGLKYKVDEIKQQIRDSLGIESKKKSRFRKSSSTETQARHQAEGAASLQTSVRLSKAAPYEMYTNEGLRVVIYQEDITTLDNDAIVNAANEHLQHSAGVAGAISKVGGLSIQQACKEYIAKNGRLPTGKSFATYSGKLPCSRVIHTVGPMWDASQLNKDFSRKLKQAFSSCLEKAHQLGVKNLAIPLVSSGIFGGPKYICAEILYDSIMAFSAQSHDHPSLQEIHLVNIDSETTECLREVFEENILTKSHQTDVDKFRAKSSNEIKRHSEEDKKGKSSMSQKVETLKDHDLVTGKHSATSHSKHDLSGMMSGKTVEVSSLGTSAQRESKQTVMKSYADATALKPRPKDTEFGMTKDKMNINPNDYSKAPRINCKDHRSNEFSNAGGNGTPNGSTGTMTNKDRMKNDDMRKTAADSHVNSSQNLTASGEDEKCPICLDNIEMLKNVVKLPKCNHKLCSSCFSQYDTPKCPVCGIVYGTIRGNMPPGTMDVQTFRSSLPGYEGYGTISINYNFRRGKQTKDHPNPGAHYVGTTRIAYLPNNLEGQKVLRLLKKAFDADLTFTIGQSRTTGCDNQVTWNDIHHKTSTHGGPSSFGYPDKDYLSRVQEELAAKGITE